MSEKGLVDDGKCGGGMEFVSCLLFPPLGWIGLFWHEEGKKGRQG